MRNITRDELHRIITEEHERQVLIETRPILAENETTVSEYAEAENIGRTTAFKRLEALALSGVLEKETRVFNRARTNVYILKKEG